MPNYKTVFSIFFTDSVVKIATTENVLVVLMDKEDTI